MKFTRAVKMPTTKAVFSWDFSVLYYASRKLFWHAAKPSCVASQNSYDTISKL